MQRKERDQQKTQQAPGQCPHAGHRIIGEQRGNQRGDDDAGKDEAFPRTGELQTLGRVLAQIATPGLVGDHDNGEAECAGGQRDE